MGLLSLCVISGSYQSGAPYTVYPAAPGVPAAAGQGAYIHVYQTTPSVVVIGGCPACRVQLFSALIVLYQSLIVSTVYWWLQISVKYHEIALQCPVTVYWLHPPTSLQ